MKGVSITTLQTALLSQKTIKVPIGYLGRWSRSRVVDFRDKVDTYNEFSPNSLVNILTRNALKSTSNTTPQPRLWQEDTGCSTTNTSHTEQCLLQTNTFARLSELSSPYLAQLPVGYHTGLIRQFIPRINSSITFGTVAPEEMPANCSEMPNSFYALYANAMPPATDWDVPRNWSIEVCMPGDQETSPWKSTFSRQDFTEELYLNISVLGYSNMINPDPLTTGGVFRVTSETTAGYFELPNYMNGGQAGPLLEGEDETIDHCHRFYDCPRQSTLSRAVLPRAEPPVANFQTNGSLSLAMVKNKGVGQLLVPLICHSLMNDCSLC